MNLANVWQFIPWQIYLFCFILGIIILILLSKLPNEKETKQE